MILTSKAIKYSRCQWGITLPPPNCPSPGVVSGPPPAFVQFLESPGIKKSSFQWTGKAWNQALVVENPGKLHGESWKTKCSCSTLKGGRYSITECIGFRSWSLFLAVSLQVTWVINPVVGCHYFPPGLQLPSQPSWLLPVSLLGEQRHDGCEQFA